MLDQGLDFNQFSGPAAQFVCFLCALYTPEFSTDLFQIHITHSLDQGLDASQFLVLCTSSFGRLGANFVFLVCAFRSFFSFQWIFSKFTLNFHWIMVQTTVHFPYWLVTFVATVGPTWFVLVCTLLSRLFNWSFSNSHQIFIGPRSSLQSIFINH